MFASRKLVGAAVLALTAFWSVSAIAQAYPNRPVRIIVPFSPGGGTDLLTRTFAAELQKVWGQSVVVENIAGAGGIVGTQAAARSAPDGYTLLLGSNGTHSTSVSLQKALPYDPVGDFEPVTLLATAPNILVVGSSFPVKSTSELIAYAKANPGKVTYASAGNGTAAHLAAEVFRSTAGIDIVHVPYRGSSLAHLDVIAGRISMMFDYPPTAVRYMQDGKFRGLGVTSPKRFRMVPELPTMVEAGLEEFNMLTWYAIYAPRGTPADILENIRTAMGKASTSPTLMKRVDELALDLVMSGPAELSAFQKAEIARWAKVIKAANIKAD